MAYGSTLTAIMAKYATLTAANFPDATLPDIWVDEAPQEQGAGAQQRVPYTIIEDNADNPEWTFGGPPGIITGEITMTVYYPSTALRDGLGDGDQAMDAILWNGGVPISKLGIAFMTMDLASPLRSMAVIPGPSQRKYAGFSYLGRPVYSVMQKFKTKVEVVGAGY